MSTPCYRLPLREKVGYALGDAAANFVWRSAFFLPIFYTDTYQLAAAQVAVLLLIVRLSDGVTDVIMGAIADRTESKYGKFRPWILWSAPVLGLFLALVFTTPNLGDTGKLIYAYVIYFGLTLAYTANNVPYGALMGVMTPSVKERSVLASYRFAGAFGGGLLVMALLPKLVELFGNGNEADGYKHSMQVFAFFLVLFFIVTYKTTKERVQPIVNYQRSLKAEILDIGINLPVILVPIVGISIFLISLTQNDWSATVKLFCGLICLASFALTLYLRHRLLVKPDQDRTHTQKDLADLLSNKPWLILLIVGIFFGIFTVVRPSAAGYYFKYYIGITHVDIFGVSIPSLSFYFVLTLVASLFSTLATGMLSKRFNKRTLYMAAFLGGSFFCGLIYFVQPGELTRLYVLAFIGEFFAGMMPVLFFSMLGDTADYSEWKSNRRATGLVYSAGTFINKTGQGFAGAILLLVLAAYGYNSQLAETIAPAKEGMQLLMSLIPAGLGVVGLFCVFFYPLDDKKMQEIEADLKARRLAEQ